MKKTIVLASGLSLLAPALRAQSDFRPGYVVPLSGDTLRGQVEQRSPQNMAREMRFRTNEEAAVTRYSPAQLRAAGFRPGNRYEAQTVGGSPVFLTVLAKGPATLYRYADASDKIHYYVQTAQQPLTELVQRDTTESATVNGVTRSVKTRYYPFRQVLATSFAGCYTLTKDIARAQLNESELLSLFARYYACQGTVAATTTVAELPQNRTRLRLVGGATRTTVPFNEQTEATITSGLLPTFGVGAAFQPGSFNPRLSILVDVLYFKTNLHGEYTRSGSGTNLLGTAYGTVDMSWHTLQVPFALRVMLSKSAGLKPFLQAGPQVELRVGGKGGYTVIDRAPGKVDSKFSSDLTVRSFGYGGHVGAGLQIPLGKAGALQPEVRYGITDNVLADFRASGEDQLSFLLSYVFGN